MDYTIGNRSVFRVLMDQLADDEVARQRICARIAVVGSSIAQAEAALAIARVEERALLRHLEAKDRQLAQQRRVLSPVSSLPDEALGIIFRFAQQRGDDDCSDSDADEHGFSDDIAKDHATVAYALRAAITVSLVSKRWRAAALEHPRIWSFLKFDFRKLSYFNSEGVEPFQVRQQRSMDMLDGMSLHLARSKCVPLEISLHHGSLGNDEPRARLFSMISACASR
ncbi:hypothetical protein AURDEDRAFT_173993 [Auricularia subglabra TFB-10046 SS5]|uniref:Uncharacterized protein n=1 Tax=Auricularia subglabra (strain TFB-10046 / SS5) TaxID=717982 RepID=J0LGN1_AURST|nr:hypothetical protein AURDEDRAFT_173993 [Auricularia subglabra TFB-10046 SS5]